VTPNVAISGTAATGIALASATVSFSCVQGSGSTLSDGGGRYTITFNATPPCILTVTSGDTSLHSLAFAGGTFNTTPETELMFVYIASQLGTNESGLIAGFPTNSHFQQVLANQADVQAAQSAVVTNLQQHYAVTLTAPDFLTTSFTVGQAGVDSDLGALAAAGSRTSAYRDVCTLFRHAGRRGNFLGVFAGFRGLDVRLPTGAVNGRIGQGQGASENALNSLELIRK